MNPPSGIRIEGVTHYFAKPGSKEYTPVLSDVSLEARAGQFLALVGPSGCGKTTLLNMIAGLVQPTHGKVYRGEELATRPDRDVAYMLARAALFPWRTAQKNVELGLELRGAPRQERADTAARLLELTGLKDFAKSYPSHLSQGMRQRVALARTFALKPKFVLMDEPFSALDAQTKLAHQEEFVRIWEQTRTTAVLVTHDLAEAILMADRVVVFSPRPGRIKADLEIQLPRPRDLETLRFDERYRDIHERMWMELKQDVDHA
ncbi:ABC transporter ATP-binding protein [Microtetraspora sp. NBRC 16547]|uniref:ABC transporter ATP-binding protein n=1 Tax=Microtetraspora sp. NBRC 16547 TaxID=3030993 RepID=UPI0024A5B53E|nr:ABC transporter ATP-binding protein [Microtetraspora sp. NBRC 16547]GLW99366.1 ABC transporter ATP-binding protein [Microtetraspora sp. NBRC 16547]